MSARLALGAVGALVGLAALGARRGSQSEGIAGLRFERMEAPGTGLVRLQASRHEQAGHALRSGVCGEDDHLYHVTIMERLPGILSSGLRPRHPRERASFPDMQAWSRGRLFFAASVDDLGYWFDIVSESDAGRASAWRPVVLKVPGRYVDSELQDALFLDDYGGGRPCTVFTYESVPASELRVDTSGTRPGGTQWRPKWNRLTWDRILALSQRLSLDGARPLSPHLAPRQVSRVASLAEARAMIRDERDRWQRISEDFVDWYDEIGLDEPANSLDHLHPRSWRDGGGWIVEYSDLGSLLKLDEAVS